MRIIAGRLGSRQFEALKGFTTHPMGDRVRTALFNTLGDISGLTVLDAFGGSGALAFEAVSRGAAHATVLEVDKDAYKLIRKNVESLNLEEQVTVHAIYAKAWSNRNKDKTFDLIFCDPPYNNLQEKTLEKLALHVTTGGLAVYSLPPHGDIRLSTDMFKLEVRKEYGDATLAFYRKII